MKNLVIVSLFVSLSFTQGLFLSEYIEGSSNNKALEIYNPTNNTINLSGYELWRIANGGDWDEGESNAVALSGYSIAPGDVFVICNSSIYDEYSAPCDILGTDITYYNGDDAIGLAYNGTLIDAVGDDGEDPGTAWDVAGITNATKEHTLVRKMSINEGNTNWTSSAGSNLDNSEWVVFDQNTFDYLGSHTELGPLEGCMDPSAANYDPNATLPCNDCCEYADQMTIYDIQYTSDQGEYCYESEYDQQYVTTTGVVTAVKPGSYNFYIQDFNFDTYAGIYVYGANQNPVLGEEITLTAQVSEYYSFTELIDVSSYNVNSNGNGLTIKDISTGDLAGCTQTGESLEGMLVRISNVTVTQETNNYDEWYVNDGSGDCQIDGGMFDGDWFFPSLGQEFASIVGVVDYAYGSFAVLPRIMNDISQCSTCLVADAGNDQSVEPNSTVTLDGAASYDPNGNITNYEWQQISGAAVELSDEESAITTFTAPPFEDILEFRLTVVSDNEAEPKTDEVSINVISPIPIIDIQYTTNDAGGECYDSPYKDESVLTTGVVSAVKYGVSFYLSQPGASSWGGIYVYDPDFHPEVGEEIKLNAIVDEFYGCSQLIDIDNTSIISDNNTVTSANINTGDLQSLPFECNYSSEQYEGMLVKVTNVMVEGITEYGEWIVNDGTGEILVDDYFFNGEWPGTDNVLGENFSSITGVVEYSFGLYKILPRNSNDFSGQGCVVEAGDLNGDGNHNILDIVVLANCILNNNCINLDYGCAADINGDTNFNVLDIVTLANCILASNCGGRVDNASESRLIMRNNIISIEADGFIGGVQMTLTHGIDFTIDMTDRALFADYLSNGTETRLLVITPETDELFTYNGDFEILDIIVANTQYEISVDLPIANEIILSKAYPNPFNPVTAMDLTIRYPGIISVQVYNLKGQVINTLLNGYKPAGTYSLVWNARNIPSGVYFVKAETEGFTTIQKLMFIK